MYNELGILAKEKLNVNSHPHWSQIGVLDLTSNQETKQGDANTKHTKEELGFGYSQSKILLRNTESERPGLAWNHVTLISPKLGCQNFTIFPLSQTSDTSAAAIILAVLRKLWNKTQLLTISVPTHLQPPYGCQGLSNLGISNATWEASELFSRVLQTSLVLTRLDLGVDSRPSRCYRPEFATRCIPDRRGHSSYLYRISYGSSNRLYYCLCLRIR